MIGAAVIWITAHSLTPVRLWTAGGMAVLLEVQPDQIKVVIGLYLLRQRWLRCDLRSIDGNDLRRRITEDYFAA
jgi:hypothetical protein